jgi:SH3-like domain-containing protein
VPTILLAILLLAATAMQAAKLFDQAVPRATIVAKKIEARSAPDTAAAPLFDLFEGLEVIVRQSKNGWAQVAYPGGPIGWVPQNALFATVGKPVSERP